MSLTGIISKVVLMNCNLRDDWSYNRVMLQLLGAVGTVNHRKYNELIKVQARIQYSLKMWATGKAGNGKRDGNGNLRKKLDDWS